MKVLVLVLAILILMVSAMFRNVWVYNTRTTLLLIASTKAKEAIENEDEDWMRYHTWYDSLPSYNQMMFMISVWDRNEWIRTLPE